MAAATAAATAAVAARAILDDVETDYAHDASLIDVSTALSDMDRAVRTFDPARPMRIYGKVSMYKDANQRASHWALWRDRNPDQAAKATPAEWDEEMKAYGILGDAVHGAAQRNTFFHLGTMPNMVFRHSFLTKLYANELEEARADHQRRDVAWHEFGVLLKNRCVYIYDPSYDEDDRPLGHRNLTGNQRRRLNEMTMIGSKASDLIRLLRQRGLAVDKVYISGGGNEDGDCRRMTLEWIKGWVRDLLMGSPERLLSSDVWEELRP